MYNRSSVKTAIEEVQRQQRQMKAIEAKNGKDKEKDLRNIKTQLTNATAKQGMAVLPATFITTILTLITVYTLSTIYADQVLGTVPFEPLDYLGIRTMFRRGLPENDTNPSHVGYLFFFIMGNTLSRFVITKFFPGLSGAPANLTQNMGIEGVFKQLQERMEENKYE